MLVAHRILARTRERHRGAVGFTRRRLPSEMSWTLPDPDPQAWYVPHSPAPLLPERPRFHSPPTTHATYAGTDRIRAATFVAVDYVQYAGTIWSSESET